MTHLIRHDHQLAVAQAIHVGVHLVMLQAKDLFHVLNLLVLHDRVMLRFAYVEQLSAQREHSEVITTDDSKPSNGKRLSRVSFSQNQRALRRILRARVVGIC